VLPKLSITHSMSHTVRTSKPSTW